MPRIPLLASHGEGRSLDVSARQLVNVFLEAQPNSTATPLAAYGTPGLSSFTTPKVAEVRGLHEFNDKLWAVVGDTLYEISTAGTATSRGTLNTSTGFVSMADNGANSTSGGQQLMLVDGTDGWIYDLSVPGFSEITDPDFPTADTVTFLNGRFLVNEQGTGRFYGSALLDGTTWSGLDFATAEGSGDNLLAVTSLDGNLALLGERTTEMWTDTGGADFPFTRFGNGFIDIGIVGTTAWTKAGETIYAIIRDDWGHAVLAKFNGQSWQNVTPPGIAHTFAGYSSVSDVRMYAYKLAGHEFVVMNFPTGGETWVYDLTQPMEAAWHQWKTGANRHRSQNHAFFNGKNYVGDRSNGTIYELDLDTYTDNGTTTTRTIVAGPFYGDGQRLIVHELELLLETGDAAGDVTLEVSRNGGYSYGTAKSKNVSATDRAQRVRWKRLGSSYDVTFKIETDDDMKFAVVGAVMEASSGR